jgi:hypothetical protein
MDNAGEGSLRRSARIEESRGGWALFGRLLVWATRKAA